MINLSQQTFESRTVFKDEYLEFIDTSNIEQPQDM